MKKRILRLVLTVSILTSLIGAFPITVSAETDGIYTYSISDGKATIIDCDTSASGEIVIPSTLGGCPVRIIFNSAFRGCTSLESITIPDSVTSIGGHAFRGCTSLESITIPDSVTSIGYYMFSNCKKLTNITIPNSVTLIDDYAFQGCTSLESITIPDSVTSIDDYAFYGCTSLESITIPDSVTSIGGYAFAYCTSLESITIPDSVTVIDYYAFYGCESLINITIPDSVAEIGQSVFCACTSLKNITIPDSVTVIDYYAFYGCTSLESITIPDSVTSIDDYAFYGCTSLESITIPDSVASIGWYVFEGCVNLKNVYITDIVSWCNMGYRGIWSNPLYYGANLYLNNEVVTNLVIPDGLTFIDDYAFNGCTSLESIIIPDSLTGIGGYAFAHCTSLESIIIPDSLTGIGRYAFAHCTSLESITIPNSVTSISEATFCECTSLESIIIPDSVTVIDYCAFYGCNNLTDVYYGGSAEDWAKINIGFNNDALENSTIHYNCTTPGGEPEYKEPSQKTDTFNFASGKGSATFNYDDDYFANSSYIYNHDLAKMSMRLALSAFAKKTGSGANKDYSKQYINAYNLLDSCGFENIDWNADYEEKPWANGMGVIAGSKKIAYNDGDYTLIAVALRGGNYEAEWGGNFNVGNGDLHRGFETASSFAVQFIQEYVEQYKIKGNIKLWITGYSRAAATTNLTAAYFDENPDGWNDNVTLTRDNLYAYCFETPMGVKNPYNEGGLYNNIFSIVNQHDPVPMVAMRNWGFDRYGITKYLPTPQTNSNYFALKNKMVPLYDEYIGNNKADISDKDKKPYKIDTFSKFSYAAGITGMHDYINAQGVYLEKTVDKLADMIGSTANYKNKYQDAFIYIGEELLGSKNTDAFVQKLLLEITTRTAGKEAFGLIGDAFASNRKILRKSIESAFDYVGVKIDDDDIDALLQLVVDLGVDDFITILKNAGNFGQAHHPELCMAWLDAIDEDDFRDKRLRTLYLNCPVDLEVYDSNDNLVAAVYGNVPQKIEGSSIVCYIDANGQKVVYLPTDEEYRTEIIATDDGEVTYSVQEQDGVTGEIKVINYNSMIVKKDDTLTGTAENLNEKESATYELTSDSVTVEEPEVIENAEPIAITPAAEGNGNVSGGGKLLKGEFAQVTATPLKDETFLGWYDDETLVSSEPAYRFQVSEETTLTARFTENTCEIFYLTDDEDVVAVDRVLKGSSVTFPSMIQNPNYMIMGIYEDAEYIVPANEDATYSENTTLYAKVLTKDEWIQFDEVNNNIVVYTPFDVNSIQLTTVLYEEEKLTNLKLNAIDLIAGENKFDNPIKDMGTADVLKVFLWDMSTGLKPLYKNCTVDLKQ